MFVYAICSCFPRLIQARRTAETDMLLAIKWFFLSASWGFSLYREFRGGRVAINKLRFLCCFVWHPIFKMFVCLCGQKQGFKAAFLLLSAECNKKCLVERTLERTLTEHTRSWKDFTEKRTTASALPTWRFATLWMKCVERFLAVAMCPTHGATPWCEALANVNADQLSRNKPD